VTSVADRVSPDVLDHLVSDLESVFRERLEAVVLYGASAHLPGSRAGGPRDVAYTLAVVGSLSVTDLRTCAALAPAWRAKRVATPLMLTARDLRRSLDVFPLEFAEILAEHRVLRGKDPFAGLSVSRDDLRRACEVHARGHALHLREGYVESGADPRLLAQVIVHSAIPLASLLAGFSRLEGSPGDAPAFLARLASRAGFDATVFRAVDEAGRAGSMSAADAESIYPGYIEAVERLVTYIDEWQA
jgi:hypothetical protein